MKKLRKQKKKEEKKNNELKTCVYSPQIDVQLSRQDVQGRRRSNSQQKLPRRVRQILFVVEKTSGGDYTSASKRRLGDEENPASNGAF